MSQRLLPHAWEAFDPEARRPIALWFAEAAEVHEAAGDPETARYATWAAAVLGAYDEFVIPIGDQPAGGRPAGTFRNCAGRLNEASRD